MNEVPSCRTAAMGAEKIPFIKKCMKRAHPMFFFSLKFVFLRKCIVGRVIQTREPIQPSVLEPLTEYISVDEFSAGCANEPHAN